MGNVTRRVYLLALVVSGLMGLVWTLLNAGSVPAYGDTLEYLQTAQTLKVDQYRTILYPLALRTLGVVREGAAQPFTPWIYAFQWLALSLSAALFVYAATKAMRLGSTRHQTCLVIVGATSIAVTNPLIAHFSIALMSDSLASSLTIATVASLALAIPDDPARAPPNWKWLAVALPLLFLMALSRVDKLYAAAAICIATIFWAMCARRRQPALTKRNIAVVTALLLATIAATVGVNKVTQTYNPDRPPLDASSLAFNRVVWPHLAEVYPYMSAQVKGVVSPEEAKRFDQHNNNVYPLLARLLKRDPGNRAIINNMTLTTLRRLPAEVIGKAAFDVCKYTFPNVAFPLELAHVLPLSTGSDWTRSRMELVTPWLTDAALWTSQAVFLFGGLPVVLATLRRAGRQRIRREPIAWLTTTMIASNSLLFGLEAGMDAHIRYALPTYTVVQALVAAMSLNWVLTRRRNGKRTMISDKTPATVHDGR